MVIVNIAIIHLGIFYSAAFPLNPVFMNIYYFYQFPIVFIIDTNGNCNYTFGESDIRIIIFSLLQSSLQLFNYKQVFMRGRCPLEPIYYVYGFTDDN